MGCPKSETDKLMKQMEKMREEYDQMDDDDYMQKVKVYLQVVANSLTFD